jgi:hypothetical protein
MTSHEINTVESAKYAPRFLDLKLRAGWIKVTSSVIHSYWTGHQPRKLLDPGVQQGRHRPHLLFPGKLEALRPQLPLQAQAVVEDQDTQRLDALLQSRGIRVPMQHSLPKREPGCGTRGWGTAATTAEGRARRRLQARPRQVDGPGSAFSGAFGSIRSTPHRSCGPGAPGLGVSPAGADMLQEGGRVTVRL